MNVKPNYMWPQLKSEAEILQMRQVGRAVLSSGQLQECMNFASALQIIYETKCYCSLCERAAPGPGSNLGNFKLGSEGLLNLDVPEWSPETDRLQ